jgi:hypothetical protein
MNWNIEYNEEFDELRFIKNVDTTIVERRYSYGIEVGLDIYENIISIIIPEPTVLFGVTVKQLKGI